MKPSKIDPELCLRHDNGRLVCMLTKHVDDLKIAGEPHVVRKILAELQKVFGELKISWHEFTAEFDAFKTRRRRKSHSIR